MQTVSTWYSNDLFSIRIIGSGEWVRNRIETLVDDFNEPKFGHDGEYWDENDD